MSPHLLNDGLGGWFQLQSLIGVLIVDIVSNTHKLSVIIAAAEKNDRDTQDFAVRNAREVGSISAEDEFVDADRERTNEDRVEFLIVFRATDGQFCFGWLSNASVGRTYDVADPT